MTNLIERQEDQKRFMDRAVHSHGYAYGYGRVDYIDEETPVLISCHRHGLFKLTPREHIEMHHICPGCLDDQVEHLFKGVLLDKLRGAYYEAYQTFNADVAWEINQTKTPSQLLDIVLDVHEYPIEAMEEMFDVFVRVWKEMNS